MTDVLVIDASAMAALLFGEPAADMVRERIFDAKLFAPTLLDFELSNVCLTKMRREPARRQALVAAFNLRSAFHVEHLDVKQVGVLQLAEFTRLSSYDASYLWLSREIEAGLLTLDKKLAAAAAAIGS